MVKTKLKKEDQVVVTTGKDRGKRGKVLLVDRKKGRVIVEGINQKVKHVRPNQSFPNGGMVKFDYPVEISNVMYFCDKCKKGVRLGTEIKNDNTRTRVCRSCGKSID